MKTNCKPMKQKCAITFHSKSGFLANCWQTADLYLQKSKSTQPWVTVNWANVHKQLFSLLPQHLLCHKADRCSWHAVLLRCNSCHWVTETPALFDKIHTFRVVSMEQSDPTCVYFLGFLWSPCCHCSIRCVLCKDPPPQLNSQEC